MRSSTTKRKRMNGGGCGCGASHEGPSMMGRFFSGGSGFKGGSGCGASNPNPPSFANVPIRSFYGAANENENPLNQQVASRLLGGGRDRGKKRKTQRKHKNQRKHKTQRKHKNQRKQRGGTLFMSSSLMTSSPKFTLLNTNTLV